VRVVEGGGGGGGEVEVVEGCCAFCRIQVSVVKVINWPIPKQSTISTDHLSIRLERDGVVGTTAAHCMCAPQCIR